MRRFRALFLDRDGVINADIGYVSTKHRFMLKKEILPILRKAEMKGYKIIIISNQSGVGRGYFNERRNKLFNSWIKSYLYSKNISLTDMYFCFFHPESKISKYWQGDIDRKPNPGLFFKSAKDHKIDLNFSIEELLYGLDVYISPDTVDVPDGGASYITIFLRINS